MTGNRILGQRRTEVSTRIYPYEVDLCKRIASAEGISLSRILREFLLHGLENYRSQHQMQYKDNEKPTADKGKGKSGGGSYRNQIIGKRLSDD